MAPALDIRTVWHAFLPLALSWMLMAADSPICTRIAFWLPNGEVNTAAILALFSISILIESPVIDLLSTGTALTRSREAYAALARFSLILMAFSGLVHALVALTPLYDVVAVQWIGLRPEVAETARIPLALMIPWSPAIGWRRFQQGVLIRQGQSRAVGYGTLVRLVALLLMGVGLAMTKSVSGAFATACALSFSVTAECLAVHLLARPAVRSLPEGGAAPSMSSLLRFHLPLTGATVFQLMGFAAMVPALSRMPDPVFALATWQALGAVSFFAQTVTFALPEVVITYADRTGSWAVLSRFCLLVGGGLTLVVLLLVVTGANQWLFREVLQATPRVAEAAAMGLAALAFIPLVRASGNLLRGYLTAAGITVARLVATFAGSGVLVALLFLGVALNWTGPKTAVVAVLGSTVAELIALAWLWRRNRDTAMKTLQVAST
ncbi:MAG: hypothetical protein AB7F50_03265 [Fimbriimonadaceae bacterium]